MKKYLFIALAALGFAACEKTAEDNNVQQNGELEKSYISITLASSDMGTRAEGELDKEFEDGDPAESAVNKAYVFFFRDGVAFPVSYSDNTTIEDPANGKNYLPLTLQMNHETDGTNNVSDYSNEILVIENYRGEYPNQVIAVLNWQPTATNYDIADLQKELLAIKNVDGFVMCNSVYADESTPKKTIIATPITEANIGTENDLANLEAVQIYVERLAAKVTYSAANGGKFDIEKTVLDRETNTEIKVYAQIKGYELFDAYYDSWLVKQIDPQWSNEVLGFTWNDSPLYRSYWANSNRTDSFPASNSFNWNNNPAEAYCGENTRPGANDRTKVIIKAQLVQADGTTPVEVVNWLGKDYVGEDYLKIVVANTLNQKYFSSTDQKVYKGITPDDLKCVARDSSSEKAYYVYFQLKDDTAGYGINKTWYVKSADGKYTAVNMNDELKNVHPALVYKSGMTYYYTDIRHLANDVAKTGAYGVVRNHVYKVNITDITGFGTPVYDPTQDFVEVETPEEIFTYVSAQINILSWRVVDRNYQVGQ